MRTSKQELDLKIELGLLRETEDGEIVMGALAAAAVLGQNVEALTQLQAAQEELNKRMATD